MDNKDPETLVQSKETWECHGTQTDRGINILFKLKLYLNTVLLCILFYFVLLY